MTKSIFESYEIGQTPLDPNEMNGLIPKYISKQSELNSLEEENITKGLLWLSKQKKDYLNVSFCLELHKKMFQDVWKWAGKIRTTNKNIGVESFQVQIKLKELLDNVKFWLENKTYSLDEIGVRFHHRLVTIHAFSNGNGRHARFYTDHLLEKNNYEKFSWGSKLDESNEKVREMYIQSLKKADDGDLSSLLEFVRK